MITISKRSPLHTRHLIIVQNCIRIRVNGDLAQHHKMIHLGAIAVTKWKTIVSY